MLHWVTNTLIFMRAYFLRSKLDYAAKAHVVETAKLYPHRGRPYSNLKRIHIFKPPQLRVGAASAAIFIKATGYDATA